MSYKYAVIGAGRQGVATAYDMVKFGEASEVLLLDICEETAVKGAERVNSLLSTDIVRGMQADASSEAQLLELLNGVDCIMSGTPYFFNRNITEVAIKIGANMVDMGGNTEVVKSQLAQDARAREKDISIVPDCGMGPGLNISLGMHAADLLDEPREVLIWDGGLPQNPEPPWNYQSTFNMNGLTNEYYGSASFLKDGDIVEVPCFEGYELLDFPEPIGKLEAFVTSGGLSTMPWTMEGILERLENKTLRYPGHRDWFKGFSELGLFEEKEIEVNGKKIAPRDFFHALLEPKIRKEHIEDVCIMRVKGIGTKDGKEAQSHIELTDYYDQSTGFRAMERLTGWHASIVAILATHGKAGKGVVPVELAVSGRTVIDEFARRGIVISEKVEIVK